MEQGIAFANYVFGGLGWILFFGLDEDAYGT